MLALPVPKNLRSFLCITLMWLCHPQPAVWAWQSGHPVSSAVTAEISQQTSAADAPLPDVPDADDVDLPHAEPVPAPQRRTVPVHIEANEQHKDGPVYTLLGDVDLHYGQYVLRADKVNYNQDTGEVRAEGHLQLDGGTNDEHILADHATLNLDLDTGRFYDVTGSVGVRGNLTRRKVIYTSPNPFLFTGRVVIKSGPMQFRVIDGTMTSCRLPRPDWRISAGRIDMGDGQASARNAIFRVLNVPVVYLPYVTHPVMSSDRQSGFLIPVYSQSSTKGTVLGEQVYLALNRSMDLTIGTDFFSRRGWAPSGEFRYRGQGLDFANLRFTALFDRGITLGHTFQNQGGQDILLNGRYTVGPHTRLVANAEYLSSIVYREAFAESFSQATASQVNSNIYLTHNDNGISQSASFARYINYAQVQPFVEDVVIAHLPSLSATAVERKLAGTPLLWDAEGSASGLNRHEPSFRTAHEVGRVDLHPTLSLPLHFGGPGESGLAVRPWAGVRETFYSKSQAPRFILDPVTKSLVPVYRSASLDRKDVEAGVELRAPVVERDFTPGWLGRRDRILRHTVEAEARYSYVAGIDNFRNILRFDPTELASDTNEIEYSLTQHFYLKRLHGAPCGNAEPPAPSSGRIYLPADYRDCSSSDTSESLTWTVAQKRFFNPTFGHSVFNGRRNVLLTTLDLTGISFLASPRDYSPLISRLQLRTNHLVDLGWDLDYDPQAGRISGSNVYADLRHGNAFGSVSHARLDALNAMATPIAVTNYDQLRATLGYGSATKVGFSSAINIGYDLNRVELQYGGVQTSYNWNCCGLTIEYRRLALGSVRNENYESFNFTLAGIGTAGNINRSQLIY